MTQEPETMNIPAAGLRQGPLFRCEGRNCGVWLSLACALVLSVNLWSPTLLLASEPSAEQLKFFETSIRPLLAEQCLKCHGAEKQWSGLRLDSRDAVLKGGDLGPAVVAGQPDESLLIQAVRQTDADLKMPPKGKLTDAQVADLTRWVKMGAPFPVDASAATSKKRDPAHWSFQKPADVPVPAVQEGSWAQSPIDLFILQKLETAGLTPAPAADKRALLRRVTFDLTGLPPTPEETSAFVADDRPEAFAPVVDRLLASPAYGERWGRHWLDVARYADSNGLDENVAHGNAWRYRDYVVQSLNTDKPFDQFVTEQLAGDLLPAPAVADPETQRALRNERLIATGFLVLGPKVLAEVDEGKMEMDIVDEQIDTFGRVFLGLTLGCARCHDHKFDPIDTADYYALAGVFKSTRAMAHFKKVAQWYEQPVPTAADEELARQYAAQREIHQNALRTRREQAEAEVRQSLKPDQKAPEKLDSLFSAEAKAELKALEKTLAEFEKSAPQLPSAMSVADGTVANVAIHLRGNHLKLGDVVPRRVPGVFGGGQAIEFDPAHSGRLELARWLTDATHPGSQALLASRVLVNRVWRWHFGVGLVRTPDNFGLLGEIPTHPELLDWLAHRLVDEHWSLKSLHRMIVLSSTYQMSSLPAAQSVEQDPENRLFSRMPLRRLEAEELRDALLSVSGQLDLALGGSLLQVKNRGYFFDHTSRDLTDYSSPRRSLYLPIVRNNVYDVFQLLDYPDAAVPNGDRATTTIAPQALLMMNSDIVAEASAALARRLHREAESDAARIERLYELAMSRPATTAEAARSRDLLDEVQAALVPLEPDAARRLQRAWEVVCQAVLASNEFIYVN